jgi:hypothetical protein
MASIRDLKKDINKMVEQFLQECYIQIAYSPPTNIENILEIISDAAILRDEMIERITRTPEKRIRYKNRLSATGQNVTDARRACKFAACYGDYYQKISNEFYDRIVELTERLNSLNY